MAEIVLTGADVTIGGVDLSDHVREIRINYNAEMQDATAMQGNGTRRRLPGLLDWSIEIEFNQDYAAGEVDATLFPLVGDASGAAIVITPESGAVSATNPSFSGTGHLETYNPIAGRVGETNTTPCTFQAGGVLTRATS